MTLKVNFLTYKNIYLEKSTFVLSMVFKIIAVLWKNWIFSKKLSELVSINFTPEVPSKVKTKFLLQPMSNESAWEVLSALLVPYPINHLLWPH